MRCSRPVMSYRLPWSTPDDYPGSVPIPQHVVDLLYSRARRSSPWDCWMYFPRSGREPHAYHLIKWSVCGRKYVLSAHRLSLMLRLNRQLRPGMQACHSCNNPKCVNGLHIYEGTPQDNADDRRRFTATKGKVVAIRRPAAVAPFRCAAVG